MKQLNLDFANPVPRFNPIIIMFFLILTGSVAIYFLLQQQQLSSEIERINRQRAGSQNLGRSQSGMNPELERQISAARQALRSLNTPWEAMFNALEAAKQDNSSIRLLSIQPKPEKGEVLIAGTAPEFDVLVKYLNSLRQQPGLGDAVLLNQHWEQSDGISNDDGQNNLMFNLSVVWLP